jgi:hypothetical protein
MPPANTLGRPGTSVGSTRAFGEDDGAMDDLGRLPRPPSRAPDIEDDFGGPLRTDLWIDHYLPHWTTPDRSRARYDFAAMGLRLRIDDDQLDWRPDEVPLRVSNLQTGVFAGDHGSTRGMHHRPPGMTVVTPTQTRLLWAPAAGRIDVTVSATRDPGCMLAAWLIGTELESSAECGELCLFEIDAPAPGQGWTARSGIKAHGDKSLVTDMVTLDLPFDLARSHTWTLIWGEGETVLGCNGAELRRIPQSTDYPLVLLLDLFETTEPGGSYPKSAVLHSLRGWER